MGEKKDLEKIVKREKAARRLAERILEERSQELHDRNAELEKLNKSLEKEIERRTLKLKQNEKKLEVALEELEKRNQVISKLNVDLKDRIADREIMLREIHHRIKNNLQVVMSILSLQSQEINEEGKAHFEGAINRINSMASIHERIYQDNNLQFELEVYLNNLIKDITIAYNYELKIDVQVDVQIDKIVEDKIVPISLILNELINNSFKHGFSNKDHGEINISFHKDMGLNKTIILYSDNGIWVAPTENSFGLNLINVLTKQLDGDLAIENLESGTAFKFTVADLTV